ncbi:DNA-binding helix-turn-helix protein [Leptotrichia trevisanii]|uniref:DNA-binding helix-turn-helix protein n=1 Tax=Leptotrichia trevisanii TaxID=109328 RepID=A0A510KLZ7_9FUSO|nr:helix-turn-helix transcriptional regulator [Leptotrichia trevisanii]BBM45172.1 DNA-binding helix-turn-helix protein [Leptotrichia trevisanii]BBM52307.1 DNA-binding helix-turn-helix protein [Leptotrichia trevisanii]
MNKKNIGERILSLRLKFNITQEELAKKLNIKRQTIHKYENNIIKNIKYETVVKLAKIFNTTPEYLLGLDDNENEDIIISQEKLTKHNMAFFKAKDISDEDKKKMIESMQEFYYKQKLEKDKE